MSQIIIGLSGKKRHGKDFACSVMRSKGWEDSIDVYRLAFADALKEELAAACGVTPHFIEEHKDSFRLGLQWWGTEFRRKLFGDDQYWVNKAHEALRHITSPVVVVPDVRFPNEANWVKSMGGVNVRIVRTADLPISVDAHSSETALDGYEFDYTLNNNMTDDFRDDVAGFWSTVVRTKLNELAAPVL